ncbi:uncharacterized protein LOC105698395 [Orussus abietinus]|uniref:uncharacterized protein LOC105698395 n=1 Tax=Orussus abietinus TaxID=222816 RepID=UPI000625460F|nr:uncharacterized protein LOC105698395 [Orussus abietinus]XP_012278048.1 uncharacterized protein LOC105698395 [Orussus abietinus]
MEKYCPLCAGKGLKKQLKAFQLNLTEAVWLCESEECEWPYGHEDFNFFTRKVGEAWSYDWASYKNKLKTVNAPIASELALYTPPVTPSSDGHQKDSLPSDIMGFTTAHELEKEASGVFASSGNIMLTNSGKILQQENQKTPKLTLSSHVKSIVPVCTNSKPVIESINSEKKLALSNFDISFLKENSIDRASGNSDVNETIQQSELRTSIVENVQSGMKCTKTLISHTSVIEDGFDTIIPLQLNSKDITTIPTCDKPSIPINRCNNIVPNEGYVEEEDIQKECKNVQGMNEDKDFPKIVSIEKTNFAINGIVGKTIGFHSKSSTGVNTPEEVCVVNTVPRDIKVIKDRCNISKTQSRIELPLELNSSQNNQELVINTNCVNMSSPNIQITTMKVDGLPPVTLAYEVITNDVTDVKPTISDMSGSCNAAQIGTCSKLKTVPGPLNNNRLKRSKRHNKRNLSEGKRYEKFSFTALQNQIENGKSTNTSEDSKEISIVDGDLSMNTIQKSVPSIPAATLTSDLMASSNCSSSETYPTINSDETNILLSEPNIELTISNFISSSTNVPNDTSQPDCDTNLECLLDDLLVNHCHVSQEANDDWLMSLLN